MSGWNDRFGYRKPDRRQRTSVTVAIEDDRSWPGARDAVTDHLHATLGLPQTIVVDNGPEFAGRAIEAWCLDDNNMRPHSARQTSTAQRSGSSL